MDQRFKYKIKTMKLLEKSIDVNLYDFGLDYCFLARTPKG